MSAVLVLALTFGLMYALFIRPQSKRVKAHRELLGAVEVGDSVMLTSGLYGLVVQVDVDEDVIWLEVADGVELKVARGAVAKKVTPATPAADEDDDDHEPDDELDDDAVTDEVGDTVAPLNDDPSDEVRPDPTDRD